jgi:hypothetical protein
MRDYAREENGAQIVMATSVDERFPPENMLDGKDSTFWMTTGMFPQEFVVALRTGVHVSKITTLSLNGMVRSRSDAQLAELYSMSAQAQTIDAVWLLMMHMQCGSLQWRSVNQKSRIHLRRCLKLVGAILLLL